MLPFLGFIGGIASWFIKGAVGSFIKKEGFNILDRVLNTVDKRVSDENKAEEIKNDLLKSYLEAQIQMANTRKDAFGPWAWFMAFLFLPGPVIWWNAVFLVSVFPMDGVVVLALPPQFYPWMTAIISALFFIPTINGAFGRK